jgi:hypothetical protein
MSCSLLTTSAKGDIPETTEGFVSTATITATQTVLVTATASGTKGAGSSIVGPIVGGVVGGVAFVALVAVAGFYFMIRRKAPQIQVLSNSSVLGSPSTVPGSSTLFSGAPSPPTRHMTGTGGGLLVSAKFYIRVFDDMDMAWTRRRMNLGLSIHWPPLGFRIRTTTQLQCMLHHQIHISRSPGGIICTELCKTIPSFRNVVIINTFVMFYCILRKEL